MENQNRWKLRISRLLQSSCGSCKSRNTSDVIERSEIVPQTDEHYQVIELFSPTPIPDRIPSIFRPKSPQTQKTEIFPMSNGRDLNPLFTHNTEGRKFPPTSAISPLITFREFEQSQSKPRRKKTTQLLRREHSENYYDHSDTEDGGGGGGGDDEKTALLSSISLSSDSFRRNRENHEINRSTTDQSEMGEILLQGKVKNSFVVKKRSSDPYDDFRNSMVEMIVERQIFGARDLEDLLETFLSLNSCHHHGVIIDVFTEIWDALFSKLSRNEN